MAFCNELANRTACPIRTRSGELPRAVRCNHLRLARLAWRDVGHTPTIATPCGCFSQWPWVSSPSASGDRGPLRSSGSTAVPGSQVSTRCAMSQPVFVGPARRRRSALRVCGAFVVAASAAFFAVVVSAFRSAWKIPVKLRLATAARRQVVAQMLLVRLVLAILALLVPLAAIGIVAHTGASSEAAPAAPVRPVAATPQTVSSDGSGPLGAAHTPRAPVSRGAGVTTVAEPPAMASGAKTLPAPGTTRSSHSTPSATAPGRTGSSPSDTAPGRTGSSPSDTAPGRTGSSPSDTAPGRVNVTPSATTPGRVDATPSATVPGQVGSTPAVTAPGNGPVKQ